MSCCRGPGFGVAGEKFGPGTGGGAESTQQVHCQLQARPRTPVPQPTQHCPMLNTPQPCSSRCINNQEASNQTHLDLGVNHVLGEAGAVGGLRHLRAQEAVASLAAPRHLCGMGRRCGGVRDAAGWGGLGCTAAPRHSTPCSGRGKRSRRAHFGCTPASPNTAWRLLTTIRQAKKQEIKQQAHLAQLLGEAHLGDHHARHAGHLQAARGWGISSMLQAPVTQPAACGLQLAAAAACCIPWCSLLPRACHSA